MTLGSDVEWVELFWVSCSCGGRKRRGHDPPPTDWLTDWMTDSRNLPVLVPVKVGKVGYQCCTGKTILHLPDFDQSVAILTTTQIPEKNSGFGPTFLNRPRWHAWYSRLRYLYQSVLYDKIMSCTTQISRVAFIHPARPRFRRTILGSATF